jgi:hypothetical protein
MSDTKGTMNSIGWAVKSMHNGERVRRPGWNGKGMYLFLVPGSTFIVMGDRPMGKACPELVGKEIAYHAHVDMKTAQGDVVPWLCSQSDLLATDWELAD